MATLKLTRPLSAKRVPTCMDKWTYIAFMHKLAREERSLRARAMKWEPDGDEQFFGERRTW